MAPRESTEAARDESLAVALWLHGSVRTRRRANKAEPPERASRALGAGEVTRARPVTAVDGRAREV